MEKHNILLSLAVHEKIDILIDQIKNIKKYIPNSYLVIHISKNMLDKNKKNIYNKLAEFNNLYVNTQSIYTGYLDGTVLMCHLLNIKYAESINLKYSYLLLLGSNEMYVRNGVSEYIKLFKSSNSWKRQDSTQYDDGFNRAIHDPYLTALLKKYNFQLKKRAPEGTFYNYTLIKNSPIIKLLYSSRFNFFSMFYTNKTLSYIRNILLTPAARLINKLKFINFLAPFGYATEEFYLPSFFCGLNDVSEPVCYMDWDNKLRITEKQVDLIRSGIYSEKFSVKRVNRDINDKVRIHINKLL